MESVRIEFEKTDFKILLCKNEGKPKMYSVNLFKEDDVFIHVDEWDSKYIE